MATLPFEVTEALRRGNRIQAVRLLRESSGEGLKESKDAVEKFLREHPETMNQHSPGEVPPMKTWVWLIAVLAAAAAVGYYIASAA